MRGITRAPFVAFLGILVVAAMFGACAAADEFIDPNDLYGDTVLYTPQAAPAEHRLANLAPAVLWPKKVWGGSRGALPVSRRLYG